MPAGAEGAATTAMGEVADAAGGTTSRTNGRDVSVRLDVGPQPVDVSKASIVNSEHQRNIFERDIEET